MEKLYFTGGLGKWPNESADRMLQEKINEVIDRISEHEDAFKWTKEFQKMWYDGVEQILLQCKAKSIIDKAQGSKITRYELSNDRVGLTAYLKNGTSYHIHSNELTSDQLQIRNQLVDMEG